VLSSNSTRGKLIYVKKDDIDETSDEYDDYFSEEDEPEVAKAAPVKKRRENTPEKLYREFVEEAKYHYKRGIPSTELKPVNLVAL
jgi:hypothetical protein